MLFSSIPFLFYFLPVVLIIYYSVPKKCKNTVLLVSSLLFYGWGEPKYLVLMIISILSGYIFGLLIEKSKSRKIAKTYLVLSLITGIGMLCYFKYADFFISNVNTLTGAEFTLLKIALPIGISFFTFQVLSYTVDVYWGNARAQKNIISFASYVSMFPQLIAGPIVRYVDVARELDNRNITSEKIYTGLKRFIVGLSKKVLIANLLGELCNIFRQSDEKTVLFYWIYAVAFTLHIYFDFSGYSDMAIGLGKMMGFHFPENFNYPYISKSITEFWRRWHISLGSWFRDYVYIPLGGNRVNTVRWIFNIFVVWLLTGFWHGSAWNFILWGLMFAVLLVAEKFFIGKILSKVPSLLSHIYVMFLITISFVIFNAYDVSEAFSYIGSMFGFSDIPLYNNITLYYLKSYVVVLIIGIIGATPLVKTVVSKINIRIKSVTEPFVLVCLFILVTAYLVDGSFNPFLYFRF